jgi:hypothetical protein|tara:strand:- start:1210 stop:1740 length:531 start_codon:yes stop_codon:yes gene_type:complete
MKKSELKSYIKENIIETLSPEQVEKKIDNIVKMSPKADRKSLEKLSKFKKHGEMSGFDMRGLKEEPAEDAEAQAELNAELEKTIKLKAEMGLKEDEDDDVDAKAIKVAKGARGKFKKLDLAVKALKSIETEMKSLARKYSAGDETEKEKIKNILRVKTPQKKELESLVAKLEKDVV